MKQLFPRLIRRFTDILAGRRGRGSGAHHEFGCKNALRNYLGNGVNFYRWEIGNWSYGFPTILGGGEAHLIIGKFTSIASGCRILLGHEHNTSWISTYPFSAAPGAWPAAAKITGHPCTRGPVLIGNDVWIGEDVTILSGSVIGDGSIIGAKSLVRGVVPPYSIVGGIPARLIRLRFDPQIIDQLLRIAWWTWDDAAVAKVVPLLCSNRLDEFLHLYGSDS